jgi:hypothetical protein
MALMVVYEKKGNIPVAVIDKGFRYLERRYCSAEDLPALWIGKVLYNPYHIVNSVLQSTLLKYQSLRKKAAMTLVF